MVLKISWPLTKDRYISQVHIDCIISSYGTCSIFTRAGTIINNNILDIMGFDIYGIK
jgi:hypothetical protein